MPGLHPPLRKRSLYLRNLFVQPVWEYKCIATELPPGKAELNAPGAEGWEPVGLIPTREGVSLYFKRLVP